MGAVVAGHGHGDEADRYSPGFGCFPKQSGGELIRYRGSDTWRVSVRSDLTFFGHDCGGLGRNFNITYGLQLVQCFPRRIGILA